MGVAHTCLDLNQGRCTDRMAFAQVPRAAERNVRRGCMQFIPEKTPTADGTCKIVQGSISPKGWCMFFTAKS